MYVQKHDDGVYPPWQLYDICWEIIGFDSLKDYIEGIAQLRSVLYSCEVLPQHRGYYRLLKCIFGEKTLSCSFEDVIDVYLRSIAKGKEPSDDLKVDLAQAAASGRGKWLAPVWSEVVKEDIEQLFTSLLKTLSQREQEILTLRFGLQGKEPLDLTEVGREFGITRERVRQIEAKAIRKLRHPNRNRSLRCLFTMDVVPRELTDMMYERKLKTLELQLSERRRTIEEELNNKKEELELLNKFNSQDLSYNSQDLILEELELSVRAYNCLKKANIFTLTDLLKKSEREIMEIKNFGRKSAEEVIDRVHAMGYRLQPSKPSGGNMHNFIQRLSNAEVQIKQDLEIGASGDSPMEATRNSLSGEESIEGTRIQYREALKEFSYLTGSNKNLAEEKLEEFRKAYKDYLPILEG